jgi:hypothetical protein
LRATGGVLCVVRSCVWGRCSDSHIEGNIFVILIHEEIQSRLYSENACYHTAIYEPNT